MDNSKLRRAWRAYHHWKDRETLALFQARGAVIDPAFFLAQAKKHQRRAQIARDFMLRQGRAAEVLP